MKKTICSMLSITIIFLFSTTYIYSNQSIDLKGETAVLIDGTTGEILYDKKMHQEMYPASTTKIMTAILVLENCDLDETVIIDDETPFTEGSRIYLLEDERVTIEQLLHALLIESANDAAVALAKHISGSVENFCNRMNQRAEELGALNTHFNNPNGLPDEEHYTTAYDLAMIAKHALKKDKFREIITIVNYHMPATNKQDDRYFRITNRMLWDSKKIFDYNGEYVAPMYEYATGVKTGYTIASGYCLVASAEKNNREVISVVLKSDPNSVYLDSRKLLDHGLNDYKNIEIQKQGDLAGIVRVQGGATKFVDAVVTEDIVKTVSKDFDEANIKKEVMLPEDLTAPVDKGDRLGSINVTINGEEVDTIALFASAGIEKSFAASMAVKAGGAFKSLKIVLLFVILAILGNIGQIVIVNVRRIKRRRHRRQKYKIDSNYINRNILK